MSTGALQPAQGMALVTASLQDKRVARVSVGVGSSITLSLEGSDLHLWIFLSAWSLTRGDVLLVGSDFAHETLLAPLRALEGALVEGLQVGNANRLVVHFSGSLELFVLPTFSDEEPWQVFATDQWFLGARADGTFELELDSDSADVAAVIRGVTDAES